MPEPKFHQRLRELTKKHGILLIADEVQSGMGRTGKMFAIEHFGVEPDMVAVAKGVASGLPLGVTTARADVMTWPPGSHASTFGGNPVSCAAALKTIELLKNSLMKNAAEVGAFMIDRLRELQQKHQIIGDVRGRGLMIGIELVRDRVTKERAIDRARQGRRRLLQARPAGPRRRQERDPHLAAAGADEGPGRDRRRDHRRGDGRSRRLSAVRAGALLSERHSLLRSLVTPGQINGWSRCVRPTVDVACQKPARRLALDAPDLDTLSRLLPAELAPSG